MSEIVIRHAEPKDYDAIRLRSTPNRRCTTTHYRFLIRLSKCGKNDSPTSPALSNWSPV